MNDYNHTGSNVPNQPTIPPMPKASNLIDRQAAINDAKSWVGVNWYEQRLRRNIIEWLEGFPSAQQWIPVTENTLPEENRVVVVCGNKGTWDFGTYRGHGDDIHFWHWKKNSYKRVYWWMYKEDALPEPYKGVTE